MMTDAANGAVADYPYVIKASAKGSESASFFSGMNIDKCTVTPASLNYDYTIPAEG